MTETKDVKKRGRVGQIRCPNCFERFRPLKGAAQSTCPACGWEWHISWKGTLAKIRKPVWENWERQMAEPEQTKG
jgi:hypothetical protein